MTAYGYGEHSVEGNTISLSITGLNRKALEVILDLPKPLEGLERDTLNYIQGKVKRGRVSLKAQLQQTQTPASIALPSLSAFQGVLDGLKTMAEHNGIAYKPTVDTLAQLLAFLPLSKPESPSLTDARAYHSPFFAALDQAFAAFETSRSQEGLALKTDITLHLSSLEKSSQAVKALSQDTVSSYRVKLLDRLKQAGLELDLQDERVLKEIALFADRCDITEELTRLESHYQQFRAALEDQHSGSRKIDFLCQEIQREWNTIGSKANSLSITQHMLGAKLNLEKIKEQLQNLE